MEISDFNWFWSLNNGYNNATWKFNDLVDYPGDMGGILPQQGTSFTNTYANTVLPAVIFKFSSADQQTINVSQTQSSAAANALVGQWESVIGPITTQQKTDAANAIGQDPGTFTDLDYIIDYQVAYIWSCAARDKQTPVPLSGLDGNNLANNLKCMPASGNQLIGQITDWLTASSTSLDLLDQQNQATVVLNNVKTNVRQPTLQNGGVETSDGTVRPDYAISKSVSAILNGLQNKSAVSLTMNLDKVSTQSMSASVEANGGVTIPVVDFLTFGLSGKASFDVSSFKGVENTMTVNMSWPGVTYFDVTAASYATGVGWYDSSIVTQAVQNDGKDISGYHFSGQPPIPFGKGGQFARVKTLVISQYPNIDISVGVTNISEFEQSFKEEASLSVRFLGIPLGGASQSFYESSYDYDKQSGKVTISFHPGDITTIGSDPDKTAYVLGGVIDYAGVD